MRQIDYCSVSTNGGPASASHNKIEIPKLYYYETPAESANLQKRVRRGWHSSNKLSDQTLTKFLLPEIRKLSPIPLAISLLPLVAAVADHMYSKKSRATNQRTQ